MKTIFVTIEEFLANGGTLELGREIFREETRQFDTGKYSQSSMLNSSLCLGEYTGFDEKIQCYLVTSPVYKSFPVTGTVGYVKIEATPIYK